MEIAHVNGVELEYEVVGTGEPVLLISPVLADGFVPLCSQPVLTDRYQLIRYHKRGWMGSTHTASPVSVADHAADAVALLDHLGLRRAHIAGHSSGAAVAAQLALDHSEAVHTLVLLELSLLSVPAAEAFFQQVGPAFEAYGGGDHEQALAIFMSAVSGLDWPTCRAVLEQLLPGAVTQAIKDADTFFGTELPALTQWVFGSEQAAAIHRPVLSVLGAKTQPLWVDVADFLRSALPYVEDCTIDGVGHLLHIESPQPVANAMAQFFGANSMTRV
jgi:pimeloyl-ACP methyl ester carboxylesterase